MLAEMPASGVVLALLLGQLMRLMNAQCVSIHEVDVRLSLGKRVPLGRVREVMQRRSTIPKM
jgi:hypothetical protein